MPIRFVAGPFGSFSAVEIVSLCNKIITLS